MECRVSLSNMQQNSFITGSHKLSTVRCDVNVPNFFALPEYDGTDFDMTSSSFQFADATWGFRLESETSDIKSFSVFLVGLYSEIPRHNILYKMSLLDCNDKEYQEVCDGLVFDEDSAEEFLTTFKNNNETSYDRRDILTFTVLLISPELRGIDTDKQLLTEDKRNQDRKMESRVSLSNLKQNSFITGRHKLSTISCVVKVPNFFTLPEYDDTDFKIISSSFQFVDATWCFRLKSVRIRLQEKADTSSGNIKSFDVYLVLLNSEIPKNNILYKMTLLDCNDKEYQEIYDGTDFDEDFVEEFVARFNNEKTSYDSRDILTFTVLLISSELRGMDTDKQLLTENKSIASLRDDFKDMLLNGQDHNVIFNVSDKSFRAHQDILRARSSVFRSMLSHDMLEKNTGVINVSDCEPHAFEQLLYYIYSGKVETLDENNMFGLYYAADKYNLADLKEECCEFIKKSLTVTCVCGALELATKHSDASLLNSAMEFFFDNVDDILPTVEWQIFMKENSTVANEMFIKSLKKIRETHT